jgi:phosphate transport system substrate-binding protein
MKRLLFALAVSMVIGGLAFAQAAKVDPALPAYSKTAGVSGNINSVGSDTMNNLMTLWAEAFLKMYPNVKVQIEGKGSSTAPPALIAGTAQFGPMSRAMRATEVDQFESKYGYKPTQLRTSYDALAVYVNKDNPIDKLNLAQVDAAFSKSRRRGYKENVTTWGQLGLTGDWASRPISLYGRNSASGTYGFFKEHTLQNGDYKDSVKEQPGSASVVQGVTEDRYGMGYSGIGYKTSGVKAVPLVETDGKTISDGNYDDVKSGKYPLTRFLYLYVNRAPGKPLDPVVKEYCKLIFSKEGQEVVVKDGYLPLPADIVKQELAKLE